MEVGREGGGHACVFAFSRVRHLRVCGLFAHVPPPVSPPVSPTVNPTVPQLVPQSVPPPVPTSTLEWTHTCLFRGFKLPAACLSLHMQPTHELLVVAMFVVEGRGGGQRGGGVQLAVNAATVGLQNLNSSRCFCPAARCGSAPCSSTGSSFTFSQLKF